jgi:hypothetical protein
MFSRRVLDWFNNLIHFTLIIIYLRANRTAERPNNNNNNMMMMKPNLFLLIIFYNCTSYILIITMLILFKMNVGICISSDRIIVGMISLIVLLLYE